MIDDDIYSMNKVGIDLILLKLVCDEYMIFCVSRERWTHMHIKIGYFKDHTIEWCF